MYVVIGSVTTAMRLARLIEGGAGVPADVVRTPSAIKSGGCSYSVRVNGCAERLVRETADKYGFNIKGIYEEASSGGEREYRDIS